MTPPEDLIQLLKPDLKSAFYAFVGFILTQIWLRFRARRIPLRWTATFQPIKPTTTQLVSSKVTVNVNGVAATNLQGCQVVVLNDSGRDIETFNLLFTFGSPFTIVEGFGALSTSAKNLRLSEGFTNTAKTVTALPEAERGQNPSFDYLLRNREFQLPALNRAESATFTFWINSPNANDVASVIVSTEKAGVKIVSNPARLQTLNMADLRRSASIGIPLAVLTAYFAAQTTWSPLRIAMVSVLAGCVAGVVGIILLKTFRWLRRLA